MRISDWSSDVCSSDLVDAAHVGRIGFGHLRRAVAQRRHAGRLRADHRLRRNEQLDVEIGVELDRNVARQFQMLLLILSHRHMRGLVGKDIGRSEEHTSELQSLMRLSYDVLCMKKKTSTQSEM